MVISASGYRKMTVSVNELKLLVKVYTNGADEEDCISQVSEILSDVLGQYAESFNNVKAYSIEQSVLRCIDSRGARTMETECSIIVNDSWDALIESIRLFNQLCSDVEETFSVEGWVIGVSESRLQESIDALIASAYKDALFECVCLVPKGSKYIVESSEIKRPGSAYEPQKFSLPDNSNGARDVMLDTLESLMDLSVEIDRSVLLRISC